MWQTSKGLLEKLIVFQSRKSDVFPAGEITSVGQGQHRQSRFRYARSFLENSASKSIDPIGIPLTAKVFLSSPEEVHLVFLDCGPDGWGKSVLHQAFPDLSLGMMEMLALGGAGRTGNLLFGPNPEVVSTWVPEVDPLVRLPDDNDDLEALLDAATAVDEGEATRDHLMMLVRSSRDVGGARPKARIRWNGGEHIAKFPTWSDKFDVQLVEAACLDVAQAAGIDVPDRDVLSVANRSVLIVKRFDRDEAGFAHAYLSMATLLRHPSTRYNTDKTYVDMALVARQIGVFYPEPEMFRRLLVNAYLRNTDDHLRNHAVINEGDGWRISPAFDIVPHPGVSRHVCAPARNVSATCDPKIAFSSHRSFGIGPQQADEIHQQVIDAVRRFSEFLDMRGVRQADVDLLRRSLPAFIL